MNNYKEYEIDKSTFIGSWYIPNNICDEVVDTFYKNKSKWKMGSVGSPAVTDNEVKKSTEIFVNPDEYATLLENYLPHLRDCLELYKKKYPYSNDVASYSLKSSIKIQHYKPGEGFYRWHTENDGYGNSKLRHLVFMTYLNTVENAGTEFYHQGITTPCEKGLTLIWPSAWTHQHRGVKNDYEDKFIITGWFYFNE